MTDHSEDPLANLRRIASDPSKALEIGKAAEHLVCADLVMQGVRCFLTDQGLPYDLIADVDGRLLRIQVKSNCFTRNGNARGRVARMCYIFHVRRCGKKGAKRLNNNDCDIVALVALDIKTVAYFRVEDCAQTVALDPPGGRIARVGRGGPRQAYTPTIDSFPFFKVI